MGLKGSLRNVSTGVIAIPDSEIYLQDDWGDNRLTNREDSDTTTHNGVEGIYRPEWTVDAGDVEAQNEQLEVRDQGILRADINLNLDETVTWEFSGVSEETVIDDDGDLVQLGLFSESDEFTANNRVRFYNDSYLISIDENANHTELLKYDGNERTEIITGSYQGSGSDDVYKVTRTSSGNWELFVNGNSIGTGEDTTYTEPQYTGFAVRQRGGTSNWPELDVDEYKVF